MNNFSLKLISLLLAALLSVFVHYFFVNEQGNSSVVQLIVPVEVQNLPRDLAIVWPNNRQAEVALRGPSLSLARLVTSPPIFQVEVPDGTTSRFIAALKKEDLRLSGDVEVLSIRPAELEFKLDRLIEKRVSVVVPRIGQLQGGLQINSLRPEPDSIVLYGPESELKSVRSVETLPLDLRELAESSTKSLSVRVPGTLTEARTPSISVIVSVGQVERHAVFKGIPIVIAGDAAQQYESRPASAVVEISGSASALQNLQESSLVPTVAAPSPGTMVSASEAPLRIELPEGLVLVRLEPKVVVLTRKGRSAPSKQKGVSGTAPKR